jgi:hypothetical protein
MTYLHVVERKPIRRSFGFNSSRLGNHFRNHNNQIITPTTEACVGGRRCSPAPSVDLWPTAVNEAEYGAGRQELRDGGLGRILIGAFVLKPFTRLAVLVEQNRRVVAAGAVDCGAARRRAEDSLGFGLEEGIDHVV